MDSSGSLQSSSGGDEEYDSRAAEAYSPFMIPLQPPPPPTPFDPLSNYLPYNPSTPFWPRSTNPRSEPFANPTDNFISSATYMPSFQELPGSAPSPPASENRVLNLNPPARNPKKRSRASRRAPTTVLTTDTTNFRAMVQEFTGIPAPPFTIPSPFQRNYRFDLFGSSGTVGSKPHESSQPLYLRRPFSLKVQSPPPMSLPTTTASTSSNAASNSATLNYPLSAQSPNLFNISTPNLTSFLQTHHKFPFSSSLVNDPSNLKFGEFSSPASLSSLPHHVSTSNNSNRNNTGLIDESGHHEAQTNIVNGNYNFARNVGRNILEPVASTSDFHGEKAPENVGTRTEGMVESWICSSE